LRVAGGAYLGVAFIDGPEILEPGDVGTVTLALLYADSGVDYSSLQSGVEFEVLEGPHLVATGSILKRYHV